MEKSQEAIFLETLRILTDHGVLPHLVLVGSWVEYAYQQAGYFDGFQCNVRTMDVDFVIPNLRKPVRKVPLRDLMERSGFVVHQRLDGLTRFSHGDGPLEIEFIAREMGAGQTAPYKVESLGIRVEGLRHLDVLIKNTVPVLIRANSVNVPLPQAYVLHKLIINNYRGIKKTKDLISIDELLPFIQNSKPAYQVLKEIYVNGLTKKERILVDETCKENAIKLFD